MKRFIYIALMMLIPLGITAQNNKRVQRNKSRVVNVQKRSDKTSAAKQKEVSSSEQVYDNPEVMASFPGGNAAMANWLSLNVRYPESARKNNISGRVLVQFVVEKNGRVSDVKVVRGVDPALDNEAVRVVKAMPKWTPAQHKGKAVRSQFTLPINFK